MIPKMWQPAVVESTGNRLSCFCKFPNGVGLAIFGAQHHGASLVIGAYYTPIARSYRGLTHTHTYIYIYTYSPVIEHSYGKWPMCSGFTYKHGENALIVCQRVHKLWGMFPPLLGLFGWGAGARGPAPSRSGLLFACLGVQNPLVYLW